MIALLILGIFSLAVCIAALIRVATVRRLRVAERMADISEYGFAVTPATAALPSQEPPSGVAALVGRVGEAVAQQFGGIREDELRAELMAAGMYRMAPRTLLGYRVLTAILVPALVLLLFGLTPLSLTLALVSIFAAWMFPLVLVRRRARVRLDEIDRRLPDLIDLMVVTVEAGLGFAGALREAAGQLGGSLSDELRLTLQEQTMGLSLDEALGNLLGRCDTPVMRSFVRAMAQGQRLGISTGHVMRNLALDTRKRRRKRAEEKAQKAPVRMLFPLIFLIFPSLFIVLFLPAALSLIKVLGS